MPGTQKKKVKTISQLKKQLDKVFSLWIRTRGSINGYNRCYTCGIRKPINELQCGHYVSRTALSTRWDEDNCRPQCVSCNIFKHGNMVEYSYYLEKERPGITSILRRKGKQMRKFSLLELEDMITKYSDLSTCLP